MDKEKERRYKICVDGTQMTSTNLETDDGCFRQIAHLCPDDHFEIPDATIAPSCSSGCTRDGGTCNCTQSACPAGYGYFADMDICYQWTQVA